MIVVGVDPDSDKHGVATYRDGKLFALERMGLIEIRLWMDEQSGPMIFSIENVLANNFVYRRNDQKNKALQAKVGISIGRCQQAQQELMRELDHRGVGYQLVAPTAGNWAKNKALFEANTGWAGKSNEDTRSAAYFGWLAVKTMARAAS